MKTVQKGQTLPGLEKPPITKEQLKLYASASLDHNPIHLDEAEAKKAGLPGIIAHGMLTMGFMSEFLQQAIGHLGLKNGRIYEMDCRFKSMVFPGDRISVHGTVKEVSDEGAVPKVSCDIAAVSQTGETVATGHGILISEG